MLDDDKILEKLKSQIKGRKRPKPKVSRETPLVDKLLDFLQTRRRDLLEAPMIARQAERDHQYAMQSQDPKELLDKIDKELDFHV